MADLIVSSAYSAADSLVGRFTRILEDEVKLLRGVQGDVLFIKDEMETMFGFLKDASSSFDMDGRGEVWVKQIRDLARDSENCMDTYLNNLARGTSDTPFWLRQIVTLPTRRELAIQFQELRSRAQQVSERRGRYGIRDPEPSSKRGMSHTETVFPEAGEVDAHDKECRRRRRFLVREEEPLSELLEGDTDLLVRWLTEPEPGDTPPLEQLTWPKHEMMPRQSSVPLLDLVTKEGDEIPSWYMRPEQVTEPRDETQQQQQILCLEWKAELGNDVPQQQELRLEWTEPGNQAPQTQQDLRLEWKTGQGNSNKKTPPRVISLVQQRSGDNLNHAKKVYDHSIIRQSFGIKCWVSVGQSTHPDWVFQDIIVNMQHFLEGCNYLIVLDDVSDQSLLSRIISALPGAAAGGGHSVVLVTTRTYDLANSFSPYKVFPPLDPLIDFFFAKAVSLLQGEPGHDTKRPELIRNALSKCAPDMFCLKVFLHVLYVDPSMVENSELNIHSSESSENIRQLSLLWYNSLPLRYKNCLIYLSIFPKDGTIIRRTSLVRRWTADNLITGRNGSSALDEAESCFNVLLAANFLLHSDISASGKVKSCKVNGLISNFICDIAREKKFVDAELHPDLGSRISVHNRSQLQQVLATNRVSRQKYSCWNIQKQSTENQDGQRLDELTKFFENLPAFARLGLIRVLDLEGYDGLNNNHLNNICEMFQLRYLNLRRTKITKLPRHLENLQQLETLDIRETRVSSFATKVVVLPMLKHMLAGCKSSNEYTEAEPVSTVCLPDGTGRMTNLQILCHVDVSSKEDHLIEIGKLQQLRKLGVVFRSRNSNFKHLLQAIEKLNKSLLSLSIHVEITDVHDINTAEPAAFSPPKFLQSLNICGITRGLPRWIKELHLLAKLTLRQTRLTEEDIKVLGKLSGLRCLRLLHWSYDETNLTLQEEEFQSLVFIRIECSNITGISFNKTPKIEKVVWKFTDMRSIQGIGRLPSLNQLELIGNCDPSAIKEELSTHPNQPVITHNEQENKWFW
ncbi:disease resistance protein Pik-2-like [Lolium rigidum]|uniref:disease resistance protein Pik-2-like n=1 Tax=Lolium rigidum TaxID=89674 RepID=UPI001F5C6AED|nr:disease resistance protein Pik-2-like [Lolium rigidum]